MLRVVFEKNAEKKGEKNRGTEFAKIDNKQFAESTLETYVHTFTLTHIAGKMLRGESALDI